MLILHSISVCLFFSNIFQANPPKNYVIAFLFSGDLFSLILFYTYLDFYNQAINFQFHQLQDQRF